ncbi:carbon-monoxide dehydrogenase small subunit [Micromonospora sp. Llam0]|uniref:(2Fe-2S)-binding protein n=1 Tax=Micromonospora sp. Llam0 TaxID=2485143 RepID=UPI000F47B00B|nr:(2Fe-2S)-binding protein [Micromonospora sp. Llam0]ROO62043.1 carbon-monoxide dehydrogenase small subunit [Micromonospora sp. Llam0]
MTGPATITVPVRFTANGTRHEITVDPRRSLADVLRRECGLTGTQVGCEIGVCGTCTVLVDGDPVRACLMLAVQAEGTTVETVESLQQDGRLNALQEAFRDAHALQCGFCTPGFLMLGTALLREDPAPSRGRIRQCVAANLCRCTGYTPIIDAVEAAARSGQE